MYNDGLAKSKGSKQNSLQIPVWYGCALMGNKIIG